jgi:hypothetical protein
MPAVAALARLGRIRLAVLDAVRLGPDEDETDVSAAQVRDDAERLIEAGQWHEGDPDILIVFGAGYAAPRLAWLLRDLPVEVLGRLRSDRVLYFPPRRGQTARGAARRRRPVSPAPGSWRPGLR